MNFNNTVHKIKEQYRLIGENPRKKNMYYLHYARSEWEFKYEEILKKNMGDNLCGYKNLEIGADGGDNLLFFHRAGFSWHNIYANELFEERIETLKEKLKGTKIISGNALDMKYDHFFDIVVQSTVFTSIPDPGFKRELAIKMMQIVKKDGLIIWYDFKYNNPNNKNVRSDQKGAM